MAYRQILYHIIFRTKYNAKVINHENSEYLYRYIWGTIKQQKGVLYQINGMEDHIHLLSDLHPSVALADFIKVIKTASSRWIKTTPYFPGFENWARKYCAITYSTKEKETIIRYIKNQREHHKKESFKDEMKRIFKEHDIEDNGWFWEES